MCSNTSSTSGAGVSGDDGDYATHILKKPKRQRVPKRGPGVAELEKILREQETKVIKADKGNVPIFVPADHHNINLFSPPPPPPPQPMTMLYGNGGGNKSTFSGSGGNGGNTGVRIAGSGIILPEEALLPTMWNSCESSIYEETPKMPVGYPISTSLHPCPSPTINFFPQSAGSLTSPEKQPAAGFYVHIEPPSNQRSSHHQNYSSLFPEEEKMVGAKPKLPMTLSMGNNSGSDVAPPIFQYCQASSPFTRMHTPDLSPSFSNHTTTSTGFKLQRDETLPRGEGDYGAMNGNFLIFGSPATPSSLMMTQNSRQEFSRHRSLPFPESRKEGSGLDSDQKKKPFYSFLIPVEQARREDETTLSLNNERPIRGTIDLNLKL